MRTGATRIIGIVNITEDSFSDGGLYLAPERAIAHALRLAEDGADAVDLGAASSNPDAAPVAAQEEIRRLAPVVEELARRRVAVSIDTFKPAVQRWAIGQGVAYLNDICGFADAAMREELARTRCKLIVMHSIQRSVRATRAASDAAQVLDAIVRFFDRRVAELVGAGVARERIIIDPGMGFFLGNTPEPSLLALRSIPRLRERYGLAVHVSVSRKSFLGALSGRAPAERGAATLAAELFAARQGAEYIRTHDVRALRDALRVAGALEGDG